MIVLPVLVTIGWLLALAFPLVYARMPWMNSAPGRSVMTLGLVIALALSLAEVHIFGFVLPDWTRSALYTLIDLALGFQLTTLLGVQRRRREDVRERDRSTLG